MTSCFTPYPTALAGAEVTMWVEQSWGTFKLALPTGD